MRYGLTTIMAVAVFSLGVTAAAAAETAYIDMSKVFQGYYKTQRSEDRLKEQEDVFKERAQELNAELETVRQRRDEMHEKSLNVALSEEVRKESREAARAADELYRERQQELRTFVGEKQQELRRQYMGMRDEIVKEILEHVRNYAGEHGHELVLDVSGMTNNFLPVVIQYPASQEITAVILQELNQGHEDELKAPEAE